MSGNDHGNHMEQEASHYDAEINGHRFDWGDIQYSFETEKENSDT